MMSDIADIEGTAEVCHKFVLSVFSNLQNYEFATIFTACTHGIATTNLGVEPVCSFCDAKIGYLYFSDCNF